VAQSRQTRRERQAVRGSARPAPPAQPTGPLEIRYVRLADAALWDRNAKRHDIGGLIGSIRLHGFRDAPIFDRTLGAIVAGNGRATALQEMRARGRQPGAAPQGDDANWPPHGVVEDRDGQWWVPMQFGIDAATREQAEAFGLDHNLLTATAGDLGFSELVRMFDHEKLLEVAQSAMLSGAQVVSFDMDDLRALAQFGTEPPAPASGSGSGSRELKIYTCPECGRQFTVQDAGASS
jgi:hypothetical protein